MKEGTPKYWKVKAGYINGRSPPVLVKSEESGPALTHMDTISHGGGSEEEGIQPR